MPGKICRFCESRVSELYDYWSMVNRNQEQLRAFLASSNITDEASSTSTDQTDPNTSIPCDSVPTEPEPICIDIICSFSNNEYELENELQRLPDTDTEIFESTVETIDSNCNKIYDEKLTKDKLAVTCSNCNKNFNSRGALHFHQLSHLSESDKKKLREANTCEECGARFLVKAKLVHHKRTQHGLEDSEDRTIFNDKIIKQFFSLNCTDCGTNIETFSEWMTHKKCVHKVKDPSLTCCGKKFTYRGKLIEHLTLHLKPEEFR